MFNHANRVIVMAIMEVQDWGGGLTQHEVEAIEKIKQAFQASENKKDRDLTH